MNHSYLYEFARIGTYFFGIVDIISISSLALLILVVIIRERKSIRFGLNKRDAAHRSPTLIRTDSAGAGIAVLVALLKAQGLREGFWQLSGCAVESSSAKRSEVGPTKLTPFTAIAIQRVDNIEDPATTVDAAVVNPNS